MKDACPCGSGKALQACCGRWHQNLQAPTAEALMRSRYSAYVLENEAYLLETWHPRTRPPGVAFDPGTKWLGLTVKGARDTGPGLADVEFVARYRIGGGSAVRIQELSHFVREDGRWFYLDGA